ncbi:MAG: S8 family peptidase [Ignavibacteriota bacterium]
MKLRFFPTVCILLIASSALCQQRAMSGRILFSIKPEAVAKFRSAFDLPGTHSPKFDPQRFSLTDSRSIESLFGNISGLNVASIKPFIPQHNIVLEALREKTNPILFTKQSGNSIRIIETQEIAKLRISEERISRWFELFFDPSLDTKTVIGLLMKSGIVEAAEPRFQYQLCFTPNDPFFSQQYSLFQMKVPEAWDIIRCDSTMLIADDDIGSDWTHADLAKAIFINIGETGTDAEGLDKRSNGIDDDGDGFVDDWHGWDFAGSDGTAPDNDPITAAKHGTHTAGIMAASGNNALGVIGVAFGAKLLDLKCGDNSGSTVAFGYEGIVYAADMNAKVVNNSWGSTDRSQSGQDIVNYATAKNCLVVAASGNSAAFQNLYPASYDHVLSVAATDETNRLAGFSNYNVKVDLSAPGQNVLSTVPGDRYEQMSGTSMASPNASGAAALVRQKFPSFDADQTAERLRASADPLTTDQDLRPGYSGKGRINVMRAVSNEQLYSARIDSVEIIDQSGNGTLESGESADIVIHVKNYLSPLTSLVATVEYISDPSHAISANTETVNFGKANTLSIVQNFQGSLHISVAADAPSNYTVVVRLTFSSSPESYGPDVDYFAFVINKNYLDLNKNNITATFDSKGGLGYNDPPSNMQGSGFFWNSAPSGIVDDGKNVLSTCGLMIGVDDSARIVASAPSEFSDTYINQDFAATLPIQYVLPPDKNNAVQELHTIFDDTNTDTTVEVGVTVDQKNYAFTKGLAANAVVLDYTLYRRIVDSISYCTDSTAMALFMDWDIGPSGANNQAYISPLDPAISLMRRAQAGYPYLGIKLISDIPPGAAINIYELNNDATDGSIGKYDGYSRREKWLTMTTPRASAGTRDVSMIYGLRNLPLASQDSVRATFVIAMAESEAVLKATIDATEQEWRGAASVTTPVASDNSLHLSPNPFANHLHLQWSTPSPEIAVVTISDAIGRTVISRTTRSTQLEIPNLSLPAGAYSVEVRFGDSILRQKLISLP